jgi:hypothetical protein
VVELVKLVAEAVADVLLNVAKTFDVGLEMQVFRAPLPLVVLLVARQK